MSDIKLYNGDCLEVMKSIPDKSIDMILCDLPYGTTPLKWDSVLDFSLMWNEYKRIRKPNCAICLFGQEPFSTLLRTTNIKEYKYDWYWIKEQFTNVFQVKRRPGKNVELISVFYKEQPTYNPQKYQHQGKKVTNKIKNSTFDITQGGVNSKTIQRFEYEDDGTRFPTQVLNFRKKFNKEKNIHPTQKPVDLLEYLIKTYTNENETILDNCMGSGSTGVACKHLNRNFIGIELDKEMFEKAKNRIGGE